MVKSDWRESHPLADGVRRRAIPPQGPQTSKPLPEGLRFCDKRPVVCGRRPVVRGKLLVIRDKPLKVLDKSLEVCGIAPCFFCENAVLLDEGACLWETGLEGNKSRRSREREEGQPVHRPPVHATDGFASFHDVQPYVINPAFSPADAQLVDASGHRALSSNSSGHALAKFRELPPLRVPFLKN